MTGDGPLLAFYGDDLTGSTDAMEALSLGGVRTALFLDAPDPDDLEGRFADLDAVGVAGRSRSMSPAEMDEALPPVFERLAALGAPLVQYKVCSTFDSAPDVGSIGHAVDLAQDAYESPFVPVVVGVPALGRYVVFGHLFASDGSDVHRIDRHPTMSDHPVTPMTESDLRRHLGEQTDRPIAGFDVRSLESDGVDAAFASLLRSDPELVLFDGIDADHLHTVGRLVWSRCVERADGPLFAVGSSGLDYALTEYWDDAGVISPPAATATAGADPVDRVVVVSGSASPDTAAQIDAALDGGFEGVRLDTARLMGPDADDECDRAVGAALDALDAGDSVVLYSARGPDDPALEETRRAAAENGVDDVGERLGARQGELLREILLDRDVPRVCVAGGDTSGHVVPALDVYALEFHSPLAPGCPLCVASSDRERFDGLQITLKGGQTGGESFFDDVRRGYTEAWP